jgi:FKBP-type peptidyl-prolyl cis-trans isomerase SlyD
METTAIASDTVVTLTYVLRDATGAALDDGEGSDEPVSYVHGYAQIVPGIERQIEGMRAGDKRSFTVAPDEAFGERDEEGVFEVDKGDFPDAARVKVGDEFDGEGPDGDPITMRVVEVRPDGFLMDANHPLAGQTLNVEVSVSAVRAATEEEIAAAQAALEAALSGGGCACGHDHDHDHDHAGPDHGDHDHPHDHDHDHGHGPSGLIQLGKKS